MSGDAPLILNVDDREVSRYTRTRSLKQAGFAVVEAASGAEALRLAEELRPPAVVLDVRLPDISGIEVCRTIKSRWPNVMVLQTSASFTSGADRTRGLDAGADSYLVQPAEPEELVASVKALLRIRAAEDELRRLNETLELRILNRTRDLAAANEQLRLEIIQRQNAEAALVQAQKMEAIGHLTGGIAHDFNNLLTAVLGNLDLIRRRTADPRVLRLADNAAKAATRGSKLTAQLLSFSRTQKLAVTATDVNALVGGMSELLRQSLGPEVDIRIEPGAGVGAALADVNQLELAILNLAINARDAMAAGGTVTVSTAEREVASPETGLAPGRYVTIAVADNGCGMSPDILAHAFDPFFTTKPPGKGTGLGLAQVYAIARQCGGDTRIASEPGSGTTVTLWLRRSSDPGAAVVEGLEAPAASGRNERIMLIDDDPDVRGLVEEMLHELGYEVDAVDHGAAGLELLDRQVPNLAVIDFAMPGINGAEVVMEPSRAWPHSSIPDDAMRTARSGSSP